MNKKEIIKEYGKQRCQEMHRFLDKLNMLYHFPYSDDNLYYFVVELKEIDKRDLFDAFRILERMEFYGTLKFNEIKKACIESRDLRLRTEKMESVPSLPPGCPMPDYIKKRLSKVLDADIGGVSE